MEEKAEDGVLGRLGLKLLAVTLKREENTRISLDDLVKGITPENIHGEIDWGEPVGKEIW